MEIKKILYLLILTVFLVFLAGSTGYYILFGGEYKYIDCIYMTVISLTGVGYGEIVPVTGNASAQIFTMVLIVFGMGVILYGISTTTAFLVEGNLSGILRKNRMEKQIEKLKTHYIVCGGGETGKPLLIELAKNREQFVLIEDDPEIIKQCSAEVDLFYIEGDATDDKNLIAAGIERASGIIISLPSDKDNLYVTMTARMLNKNIRIVSRMTDQKHEAKLKKAGADSVVSPNTIGALRMASEMIRPAVVGFLDTMLRSRQGDIRIHEIKISDTSRIKGKKIIESGLKDDFGLLVLGLRYQNGELEFNPSSSKTLENGMTLIVMGEIGRITEAGKI